MKKRSLIALLLCAVMLLTCACEFGKAKPKTFETNGLTIELTEDFTEEKVDGYTVAFKSDDVYVFALEESFNVLGSEMNLDEYAQLVLDANVMEAEIQHEGKLTYFTFEKNVSGKDMTYTAVVYKGEDAYWMIQFTCLTSDYADTKDTILGYASSVEV